MKPDEKKLVQLDGIIRKRDVEWLKKIGEREPKGLREDFLPTSVSLRLLHFQLIELPPSKNQVHKDCWRLTSAGMEYFK